MRRAGKGCCVGQLTATDAIHDQSMPLHAVFRLLLNQLDAQCPSRYNDDERIYTQRCSGESHREKNGKINVADLYVNAEGEYAAYREWGRLDTLT